VNNIANNLSNNVIPTSLPKTTEIMESINPLNETAQNAIKTAGKLLADPNIDTKDPLVEEQMVLLREKNQKLQELFQSRSS
jgi:hypothetical protein